MFSSIFSRSSLPVHSPLGKWHCPLPWPTINIGYTVTAFWEDLPDKCYVCGADTRTEKLNPMYIEGDLQYMKIVRFCPQGCGFTAWIA